jgi:ubiquinone biosynthesis monooxygenase Coq7
LDLLPLADERSRAVVEQMKRDEVSHANMAVGLGASVLPSAIKLSMKTAAKFMTVTAYWV